MIYFHDHDRKQIDHPNHLLEKYAKITVKCRKQLYFHRVVYQFQYQRHFCHVSRTTLQPPSVAPVISTPRGYTASALLHPPQRRKSLFGNLSTTHPHTLWTSPLNQFAA